MSVYDDIQQSAKWPQIDDYTISKCVQYLKEGKLSIADGDVLSEFESKFAQYNGSKFCLAQNNGTSTLFAAYYALGLKQGDEVLVPIFTWPATVTPLLALGLIPIFCDIDPKTLNIDLSDAQRKITNRTKALCIVHLWGNPCNMDEVELFVRKNELKLVEDCSHAHGASYKNKKVGTFGDIGCFSMQATKLLPAGEMGALVTNNEEYYNKIVQLGHQGRVENIATSENIKRYVGGLGYKFRPSPIALIIAIDQLEKLNNTNINRLKMVEIYNDILRKCKNVQIIEQEKYATRTAYSYVFRFDGNIELLVQRANAMGFKCSKMKYKLLNEIPPFIDSRKNSYCAKDVVSQLVMVDPLNTNDDNFLMESSLLLASIISGMDE